MSPVQHSAVRLISARPIHSLSRPHAVCIRNGQNVRAAHEKMLLKKCKTCLIEKHLSAFSPHRTGKLGVRSWCKSCRPKHKKEWLQKQYAYRKKDRRSTLYKYKITPQKYADILALQNGLCAICGKPHRKPLYIDHCHETKVIRGLLCPKCNSGIGLLGDSIELLNKAITYLSRPLSAGRTSATPEQPQTLAQAQLIQLQPQT